MTNVSPQELAAPEGDERCLYAYSFSVRNRIAFIARPPKTAMNESIRPGMASL
jgi:hypothetical protein